MEFKDFDEIDSRVAEFQTDPYVKASLDKGLTLYGISKMVEEELAEVEKSIVKDYFVESGNLLVLNDLMVSDDFDGPDFTHLNGQDEMDALLSEMVATVGGYKNDISKMNQDIALIQQESKALDIKLSNRKKAFKHSAELLAGITVSPDLIKKITEADINEFFITNLQELNSKLNYYTEHQDQGIKSLYNVAPELERLRIKAVEKIREFFLKRIDSFKAPNTNIALMQQNIFLKYKDLFWFLMDNYTPIGIEIHRTYVGYVSAYYLQSFERYYKALSSLQSASVDKTDLLGLDDSAKRGLFGVIKTVAVKDTSNIYGLADRLNILTSKDSGIILPDHAKEMGKKFPFEAIFKSLTRLLIDNASSEYVFTCEFFSNPSPQKSKATSQDTLNSFFNQVFELTMKFVESVLKTYIENTYDAISILFCIRINGQNLRIMQKRRLPHLDHFLNLVNILLWPRFQYIMGLHIDSLKKADPKKLMTTRDPLPHIITRRYAEFSASILTLNQGYEDALLSNSLSRVRGEYESLMYRLAAEFPDKKTALVFWINNLDLIQSILNKHTEETFDSHRSFFDTMFKDKVIEFSEYQLQPYIGSLLETLPKLEQDPTKASKENLENIANEFNANWKNAVEGIHQEMGRVFTNFNNGARVLHVILTQLVLLYKRFLTIWDAVAKAKRSKVVPIGIQTVLVEIKKYRSAFG